MALDASEVVVGANGRVYVAPADATISFPDDVADTIDTDFVEVGYISEEGVTFRVGQDVADIGAWQSFYPLRKVVTGKTTGVEFAMKQWNAHNAAFAFGGGEFNGNVFTPAEPGVLDERAMIVEWEDGNDVFMLVLPRGLVTGEVTTTIVRNESADLPVSFEITPQGAAESGDLSTQPWYFISNALGS